MDDVKSLRSMYESLEELGAFDNESEGTEHEAISDEQVASDPMTSLSTIMSGIKSIVSAIQSGEHIDDITSGLHNIAQSVKELSDSVGTLEENYGADGMEPKLVKDGDAVLQVYSDPCGDSFPERKGFVG
jgi:uncharacterized phage infection (PIP) family protein YhgE